MFGFFCFVFSEMFQMWHGPYSFKETEMKKKKRKKKEKCFSDNGGESQKHMLFVAVCLFGVNVREFFIRNTEKSVLASSSTCARLFFFFFVSAKM